MDEGIGAWVARRAERSPDAVALVDAATGARTSYAELDERVGARAGRLAGLGVGHGDRVALLGENSPAYLEWLFAAARLGAITVPVNMRLAPAEVAYVLADSGAGGAGPLDGVRPARRRRLRRRREAPPRLRGRWARPRTGRRDASRNPRADAAASPA